MKKYFNSERMVALFCAVLGVAIFFIADTFSTTFLDPVGPRIYPKFLAVLIFVPSVMLFCTAKSTPRDKAVKKDEVDAEQTVAKGYKPFFTVLGYIAAYLLLMKPIGFIISTMLFLFVLTVTFDGRPWKERLKTSIPYSVFFSIFIYVVFSEILGVLLPSLLL